MARRQTGGELTKQLGRPSGHHEYAHGIGGCCGIVARCGSLTRFCQLIDSIHIGMGAGVRAGNLNKGRLSGGTLRRGGILPQRRGLKQHAAGIKGRSQILAHCRLLASKQHNDLSPIVRHGRQQLKQAMRKRRDAAHIHCTSTSGQVIGQDAGHHIGRLAGLNHISAVQAARIGAQQLEHTNLGIAFRTRLVRTTAAALGTRPRHTRQNIAGHACEHAHRALAARKRLQVGIIETRDHIREQHLALQVVDKATAITQKLPQRTEP